MQPLLDLAPRAAAGGRRPPLGELADVSEFVEAMSGVASTVVVVTCEVEGRPWGMTVTAFCSVSTEPPTVLVSLGADTTAARAIAASGCFGVSILGERQAPIARHGSRPGAPKHLEGLLDPRTTGSTSPAVADAVSHLDCEVTDEIHVADHILFVGRVRAVASTKAETAPLLYHGRTFRTLGSA
jgi:flavin reductase (DIM6/NTAB) family NADH-FMN oxidoreductase RutF